MPIFIRYYITTLFIIAPPPLRYSSIHHSTSFPFPPLSRRYDTSTLPKKNKLSFECDCRVIQVCHSAHQSPPPRARVLPYIRLQNPTVPWGCRTGDYLRSLCMSVLRLFRCCLFSRLSRHMIATVLYDMIVTGDDDEMII